MQRLIDMSTSELIQLAGQYSASIKEVGIYSELMKELTTRLGANTAAVIQALKERDEARLELSSAQLTISQISEVLGISSSVSISEQVKQLKSENHLLGVDVELRDSVISTLKSELASQNQQVVNLAVENASLKSNLMFWDADNPELPYDSPEEIASECELNYKEELVVQVAAKLPNRTYRVCESSEIDCKLELVGGAELQTPATETAIASIKVQARIEGAHFVANRMLAAWESGFIEDTAKNAADIASMILTSTEFMPTAPEGDFDRSFADGVLEDIAAQLRKEAGNA